MGNESGYYGTYIGLLHNKTSDKTGKLMKILHQTCSFQTPVIVETFSPMDISYSTMLFNATSGG